MLKVYALGKKLSVVSLDKIPKNTAVWVDCTGITAKERDALEKKFKLHHLTAEDIYNSTGRIKVEQFPKYLFCIFYGLRMLDDRPKLVELDFVIGDNFLITNHTHSINSISKFRADKEKITHYLSEGPDSLFHELLDKEVDNFMPVLDSLGALTEEYERQAISSKDKQLLSNIMELKRGLSRAHRFTIAQREKIMLLAKEPFPHVHTSLQPYFRDVYDHSIRVTDSLAGLVDDARSAYEVYMSTLSNNMNEAMKTLSIIATIALPLTVISGIYGTNFANLPGKEMVLGFWWMLVGMLALCVFMIAYFRKKGW